MPVLTAAALKTLLEENLIRGPEFIETMQTYLEGGGGYVEDELADLEGTAPEVASDETELSVVIAALLEAGVFIEPGS